MTDIEQLLSRLNHDNWFDILVPLSDAYREAGEWGKAERCDDLRLAGKRPKMGISDDPSTKGSIRYSWGWYLEGIDHYTEEWHLPFLTVRAIDRVNQNSMYSENIQPQLLGYLEVPEHLRETR